MPRTAAVAVALSVGFCTPHVHAAAGPGSDFSSDRAQSLYDDGITKFDYEDYEGALEDLEASLELERTPLALYATAQTLNKLGRCGEAVPLYNETLTLLPDESPAVVSAVKDALVICAEKLAAVSGESRSEPEPEPEVEPEPEAEPEPERKPAWYKDIPAPILLGVGLVGVGVGGVFLGQAAGLDPESADDYGGFEVEREDQRNLRIRGGVIVGVGGVLVLGGVIRYIVVARRLRSEGRTGAAAFAPAFGPRWGGVSVQGRF